MSPEKNNKGSADRRITRYTARIEAGGLADFPKESITAVILTGLPDTAHLTGGFALGRGAWAVRAEDMNALGVFSSAASRDVLSAGLTVLMHGTSGEPFPISRSSALILDPASVDGGDSGLTVVPLDLSELVQTVTVGRALYDLTISGLPVGAAMTRGVANIDGSWTLSARELRAGPVSVELPKMIGGSIVLTCAAMTIGSQGDLEQRTRWTTVVVDGRS